MRDRHWHYDTSIGWRHVDQPRRSRLGFAGILVLALLGLARNANAVSIASYYPLQDGTSWTYQVNGVPRNVRTVAPGTTPKRLLMDRFPIGAATLPPRFTRKSAAIIASAARTKSLPLRKL